MRTSIFRACVYLGLMVLGAGLFRTQILQNRRYHEISEKNRIRLISLEAPRGRVFDRHGRLLVTNRPSFEVVVNSEEMTSESLELLSGLLKLSPQEIRERMRKNRQYRFTPAVIEEDVPKDLAFQIEERRPELPGVSIQVSSLRYYPYGETGSHVIGYIGKISREEYERLDHERFGFNSFIGRAGIEKVYDERLRGWRGGRQLEVNARGELVQVLSEKLPEPGQDLVITMDLEFQKKVMELIRHLNASVAVLDLGSESLIALASSPAYDPNAFISPAKSRERLEFLRDKEAPLVDRGVSAAYPPGSVFKLVTALAGLETGKIKPSTSFYCPGFFRLNARSRAFHCWNAEGHGSLNLYQALERSCNVYFYNVGSKLTSGELAHYARELGLGERMQLDLTQVAPGLVPDSVWKEKRTKEKWYQGDTLSFAIGQSYLLTSPIQILRLVSIIAKDGKRVEPQVVWNDEENRNEEKIAVHEENLKVLKRGMLQVVQSPYGTGQLARVDFSKFAAKTGTAQVLPRKAHSWMAGFFPYENPEIAFVVFVEHGGPGGITSAKIVKEMLKLWGERHAFPVA